MYVDMTEEMNGEMNPNPDFHQTHHHASCMQINKMQKQLWIFGKKNTFVEGITFV